MEPGTRFHFLAKTMSTSRQMADKSVATRDKESA